MIIEARIRVQRVISEKILDRAKIMSWIRYLVAQSDRLVHQSDVLTEWTKRRRTIRTGLDVEIIWWAPKPPSNPNWEEDLKNKVIAWLEETPLLNGIIGSTMEVRVRRQPVIQRTIRKP